MMYRFATPYGIFFCVIWLSILIQKAEAQTLKFSGQAIGWTVMNPPEPFQLQGGLRYIPEFSFSHPLGNFNVDGEFSANLWGSTTGYPGDSIFSDGKISPYRMWLSFYGNQFEIRAGLQKINFGSAMLFRPLMWFDRIDPRDPLQLTDGVYGLLGRYYFLNNTNIWLWGLYGDDRTKGWEVFPSLKNSVECGGRLQVPVFTGEMAASYHRRKADPRGVIPDTLLHAVSYPENRIGLDAKFDLGVGFWVEGTVIHQDLDFTDLRYTSMLNAGMDYTFNLGNGLNLMTEGFGYLRGSRLFGTDEHLIFGLLSATYPITIIHNLSAMVFYDFTNRDLYRFLNWSITYDRWSFYVMGFWNPESYQLYNFETQTNLYSGWGFQLMAVFNH
ncbi:MAG: hypothetical protein R6U78_02990 [Bacteroidales bacterium]